MRKLQANPIAKLVAVLLLLVFTFLFCTNALWLLIGPTDRQVEHWQDSTSFDRLLEDRQNEVIQCFQMKLRLEQGSYGDEFQSMVDDTTRQMRPENTNFRYKIISRDGVDVLDSNLTDSVPLNALVQHVYYCYFSPEQSDHISWDVREEIPEEELFQAENAPNGESPVLILACGVPAELDANVKDEFYTLWQDTQRNTDNTRLYLTILLGCLGLACLSFLLWTAGHAPGQETIALSWQEWLFFDYYTAAIAGGLFLLYQALRFLPDFLYSYDLDDPQFFDFFIPLAALLFTITLMLCALLMRTLVVRCKAGIFLRSVSVLRLMVWLGQETMRIYRAIPVLWGTLVFITMYAILQGVLVLHMGDGLIPLLLLLALNITALVWACRFGIGQRILRRESEAIAAGNLEHRIDTARMPTDLKHIAENLNNISGIMSEAVEERLKSERFKAELITNVSHDLKTPLTSIISYVDLLKTTQQTDPKAVEYIEVLDRKSMRLKKLTEDLVEASKASTGTLTIQRERIGMVQLLDQALGEWQEKLEARSLTVVTTVPEKELWVYADGRHLWRVIDNLLSNCAKYAMEGTRVYLDLERGQGQITLSVKNISRQPLNISPERLMERFVRGDSARTTEGSGLGLSIARSLTELQEGTFRLVVDGDLFKAVVSMPQAS